METKTKKIMKKLALVLALASAIATEGMAQTKAASGKVSSSDKVSKLSVQDLGSLRFKLAFENPLRQKTKIYLQDKDSNVFFNEYSIGDTQYVRAFNLSNLADGEYTFVVESGNEKLKKDFVISTQTFRGIALASNLK
ncbi:hypothetical protein EMA8858_00701 [Emticicia aquatica]|jgi:hypothetical protein|uniref:Uncharacterized protein n=1 Tax=Emticicia aquatica TaxID=1681835 RepID=A0ABM9ALF2_9BACT|nr:hypothetical protein [Emticicia aquatica]CAH0994591.1 hypothetical protein EMA8858_00701 [Emticicia aquatica]